MAQQYTSCRRLAEGKTESPSLVDFTSEPRRVQKVEEEVAAL